MSVHFRGVHVPDYYFDKLRKDRLAVCTCLPLFLKKCLKEILRERSDKMNK